MSSELPRLERFLEQAARAVSGTQVHPVAVLQEVQAAAESGIQDGSMPNRYRIEVSPSEYVRLSRIERQLRNGLERMLDEIALRRSASRLAGWQIELVSSTSVTDGDIHVGASFAEMAHRAEGPPEAERRPTEVITRVTGVGLVLGDGSRIRITHAPFFIGRAPGCDLVLHDLSVSRRHAVIRQQADGSLVLHDLQSRNAVTFEGERVTEVLLFPGAHFSLGDVALALETET